MQTLSCHVLVSRSRHYFCPAHGSNPLGRYDGKDRDVFGWFLPTVMPTLSLVIGVLVMDATGRGTKITKPDAFLFKLAMGLSCVYLATVLLTIVLQPFSSVPAL